MTELEAVFRVPVIEAYGMTEAAHQIASNPLPPATYEPPTEGLEQLSAALFEEVLQRPGVGRHDNFFALGGDSLRAMQVAARLINARGMEIPSTTLFSSSNAGFACGRLDGVALQRR